MISPDDLIAELASLNMAVGQALGLLASQQPDPEAFVREMTERGLLGLKTTRYWGVSSQEAVVAGAEARYSDLMGAVAKNSRRA